MIELAPYLALTIVLVAGGVLSPVPEEAALIAAGAALASGATLVALTLAVVAGVLGVVVGDLVIVAMGRVSALACGGIAGGTLVRRHRPRRGLEDRARAIIRRWGLVSIVVARFVPGLRGAVFFVSGAVGARSRMVVIVDVAAALVHVPLLLAVGAGLVRC